MEKELLSLYQVLVNQPALDQGVTYSIGECIHNNVLTTAPCEFRSSWMAEREQFENCRDSWFPRRAGSLDVMILI